jgi:ParB/RepB/Spo0J family partition protein
MVLFMSEKVTFEEIPLDLIDVGPWQARTRKIEENTDELAENIKCLGLINPITVYKKEDGRYELIAGQRRLIAVEKLGWKTIPARVLKEKPAEVVAKAISFSENILRQPLSYADVKDTIVMLYHRCGASGRTISKSLGIPYRIVLDVIKYEELPDELKKMVDEGEIDVKTAKKAVDFCTTADGNVDVSKAVTMARELKMLVPSQVKTLEKLITERPDLPAEQLIEQAKAVQPTKRIYIELLMSEYEGLRKAAETKGLSEEEAAYNALITWLKNEGFL